MSIDPRTPVLVGAAASSQHVEDARDALEPLELMAEVLMRAAEDAGSTSTYTELGVAGFRRSIERDLVGNEVVYRMVSEGGDFGSASMLRIEDIGLDLGHHVEHQFRIDEKDPLSASAECSEQLTMRRDQWEIQVTARTRLSATREHFLLQAWLNASEGDQEVFAREWQEKIERDLV